MPKVSVFLADDHVIVRKGLKELIECLGEYEVIEEFSSGKGLIEALSEGKTPDVIVLDITMPIMGGKEVMQYFKEHDIDYPVLILTLDTTENTIIDLYKLGVRGYLPKNCLPEELKRAIDDVVTTGYYHNDLLAKALTGGAKNADDDREKILGRLTTRELDFLRLVCNEAEYTYEQIADKLGVHLRTVDGYRKALFEKFNIKSKAGVVLFAIKYNLFEAFVADK